MGLKRATKIVPSLLTVGNLMLGVLALLLASGGDESRAALLVVIGMVLDGLDGRAARWLKAESLFGKELDSLSDIVTFGVAPAFIMYHLVLHSLGWMGVGLAMLFPVCGALRLARFNVQKSSTNYFVGLPITAGGGVLATMALYKGLLYPAEVILPLGMLLLALLMVSRVRYPNFKKIAFPRSAVVVVPLIALMVYGVFRYDHSLVNRIVFIPLAFYAILGFARMLKRRSKHLNDSDVKTEALKSSWK